MNIKEIRLVNFKNIEDGTVIFKNNMSGIYGPNGIGKTSIIEAIGLLKKYFSKPIEKTLVEREEFFKNKLDSIMKIGETKTLIEVLLINNETKNQYRLSLEFERTVEGYICTREELNFIERKVSPKGRERYLDEKNIIKVEYNTTAVFPEITITDFESDEFFWTTNLKEETPLREVLRNYNSFYSLMMQVNNIENGLQGAFPKYYIEEFKLLKKVQKMNPHINLEHLYESEECKEIANKINIKNKSKEIKKLKEKITNDSKLVIEKINDVKNILENILTIELKDQLLCQEKITIPIKCFSNNKLKTIVYDEKNNIYSEDDANILEETIKEINNIISIIVPDSKLISDVRVQGLSSDGNEYQKSVNLIMEKNGDKIPLVNESTGTIKLVSLISILIFCIKNKNASVFLDELDIHIFEYLLATLLIVIGKYSKGQLVFTAHNLLPMEKLNKDSIIIAAKNQGEINYTFIKTSSRTNNIRLKYLKSQSMWSEENIDPLQLNIPKLEVYIKRLVID